MLHPRYKLHYFWKAGWEDEWIQTSCQLVLDELERSYEFFTPANAEDPNQVLSEEVEEEPYRKKTKVSLARF